MRAGRYEGAYTIRRNVNFPPSLNITAALEGNGQVARSRLNQALSEHRAKVVVHYLTQRGIDERRMKAEGYGGTRPLIQGSTESARSVNRRVEITVK